MKELLESGPAAKAYLSGDESAEQWTALQWAGHLGEYVTVWWLIKGDIESDWFLKEERDLALRIAEKQRDNLLGDTQSTQAKQTMGKPSPNTSMSKWGGNEEIVLRS